jgi:uncharacterized protein (TIGR00251 family)
VSTAGGFYRPVVDAVLVQVRVTPKAGVDRIEGVETRDDGQRVLRVRVRAVPDKGRANTAVLALLATSLGLPKSALTIVSGQTARLKTVGIAADPSLLLVRLAALWPE